MLTTLRVETRQFAATAPALDPPHLHLAPSLPLGVTTFEFCQDLRHQKIRVPGLSWGIVGVILPLAVSVEHRFVTDGRTDRQTDTRRQLPALASVSRVKLLLETRGP